MKKIFSLLILAITLFTIAGCSNTTDSFIKEVNSNVNVLGIKFNMNEDQVKKLAGSDVEKEPCITGYEFAYNDKLINIGFKNEEGTVRRITTKNHDTSIYGIKPGDKLEAAFAKIKESGFTVDSSSKYKFHKNNIIVTILSMKETNADGLTIELDPDQK